MRLLLTGSGGMLGTSLLNSIRDKHEVLAPARSELNLLNSKDVFDYLSIEQPDLIIHAAARVGGIQANIQNGYEFLTENLKMDTNVFDAARQLRIHDLIYIGSTCMYPKDREQPLAESDLLTGSLEPTNEGYALSKIIGAKIVELVADQDGFNWRTLILSNLYGPRDHFEPERSHLVAAIIRKVDLALQNNSPVISMWGDGESRREFTFVNDVADFISQNLENISNFPVRMNLGAGIDYSILEYYEMISKLMGYEGKIMSDLSKPNGMKRKLSDSTLAARHGWRAKTKINDGLADTISWYYENKVK